MVSCGSFEVIFSSFPQDPGWGSVNLKHFVHASLAENLASVLEKGGVDHQQPWCDIDPHPLVGASIIFTVVFRSHASSLE